MESEGTMNIQNENRRAKVREDGTYEIVLTWKQQERLFGIVQDALYEAVSTAPSEDVCEIVKLRDAISEE